MPRQGRQLQVLMQACRRCAWGPGQPGVVQVPGELVFLRVLLLGVEHIALVAALRAQRSGTDIRQVQGDQGGQHSQKMPRKAKTLARRQREGQDCTDASDERAVKPEAENRRIGSLGDHSSSPSLLAALAPAIALTRLDALSCPWTCNPKPSGPHWKRRSCP